MSPHEHTPTSAEDASNDQPQPTSDSEATATKLSQPAADATPKPSVPRPAVPKPYAPRAVPAKPASPAETAPTETAKNTDSSQAETPVTPNGGAEHTPTSGVTAEPQVADGDANDDAELAIERDSVRVTTTGDVSVRDGESWRSVGAFPDGAPEEALAYFARKFDDLEFKVQTLEQRHSRGGASASDLRSQATKLRADVDGAAAVGDLGALLGRIDALTEQLRAASAQEQAAARLAVDEAITFRTTIVEQAEVLAARDPKTVQWKQASAELSALFDQWQDHQKNGPRLPKAQAQALWKRFREARSTIERHRRAFFAELDESHKEAKSAKSRLIERAEALATRGEDAIADYRTLLDEWKRAPRAGRKLDDALWAKFRAAGDVLYQARSERDAAEQAESEPKIAHREELLNEAAAVSSIVDLSEARRTLTAIQRKWDEVGRIFPRERERALDDRMRKIEQALKSREDEDWKRNNPETKARTNDFSDQLQESIDRLEAEVAEAEAAGDANLAASRREELEARKTWLRAIGG